MNCQFCHKPAASNSLCTNHQRTWNRCGSPKMWNGSGLRVWHQPGGRDNLVEVLSEAVMLDVHAGYMMEFYSYCQVNDMNYRVEIRESIQLNHPDFSPT